MPSWATRIIARAEAKAPPAPEPAGQRICERPGCGRPIPRGVKGGKPRSVSKKGWGKSPKGESANPKRKGKGK